MIIATAPMKAMRDWRTRTAFRRCVHLMAIFALAAGVLVAGAPARAETVAVVELRPQHTSGMCLDLANASLAHGTPVIQGTCWGGTNQR